MLGLIPLSFYLPAHEKEFDKWMLLTWNDLAGCLQIKSFGINKYLQLPMFVVIELVCKVFYTSVSS